MNERGILNESDEFFLIFRKLVAPQQMRMNLHLDENDPA